MKGLLGGKGSKDPLSALAIHPDKREEFIRLIAEDGVVLVTSVPDTEGSVTFLDYEDEGQDIFPVFSTEDRAVEFIQTIPHEKVTAYQRLNVGADFLLDNDWSASRLVLNPQSDAETEITATDIEQLRKVCTT